MYSKCILLTNDPIRKSWLRGWAVSMNVIDKFEN